MSTHALRRLHALVGVFPLGAYLGFHVWEHWPVLAGRDALLERLWYTSGGPIAPWLELALVVLPLALHGVLGVVLSRRDAAPDGPPWMSVGLRRLQLATGAGIAAFALWHLAVAWLPRVAFGADPGHAVRAWTDAAGTLTGLGLSVLGWTAVCVHLGLGVGVVVDRWAPRAPAPLSLGLGAALGAGLWLLGLQVVAAYATGRPLI